VQIKPMFPWRFWDRQSIGWAAGVLLGVGAVAPAGAEGFAGWQGLRVIEQEGYPYRMSTADLDGDGRDEIIVVNPRNARLDIYAWDEATGEAAAGRADGLAPAAQRGGTFVEISGGVTGGVSGGGGGHVNDLPMAVEVRATEVSLRQSPLDVLPSDLDGDGVLELYVIVSDPNRLLRLNVDDSGKWKKSKQWDLLPGRYTGIGPLVRLIHSDDAATALVSFDEGIQLLTLAHGDAASGRAPRAKWLEPRESVGRANWWLADLDGDGRDDLVEWTRDSQQSVRWYPGWSGGFRPAQPLHDRAVSMVALLDGGDAADELLVLESSPAGVVRRYRLAKGESSSLGQQEPLALPGGEKAVWSVVSIEGQTTLLAVDPGQPRVTLYAYDDSGWRPGESYPVIAKVKAMESVPGQAGTVLLWPEGGGDLYLTRWSQGRLSFPQPMGLAAGAKERSVLALGRVGQTVWCVQKADDDLLLHAWLAGEPKPRVTTFTNAAGKAERAVWLGEAGLLITDKFAKGLRLVTLGHASADAAPLGDAAEADSNHALKKTTDASGEQEPDALPDAISTQPKHVAKAKLDDFRLFAVAGGPPRLARFTDGVLQWLNASLHAQDQVMLPDGQRLADLVLNDDGSAWALQQGGAAIYRLTPDDAGVLRVASTTRITGGRSLHDDPDLGVLLITSQGVTRLAQGRPMQLEVVQSIDARDGRPAGVSDATVHRLMTLDLDGDGRDDALLTDDIRHQLTALTISSQKNSDAAENLVDDASPSAEPRELTALISWPVFEDKTYPYGGSGDELVREPRTVRALDFDGDGHQDLAMFSHDRLLIYLAHEPSEEAQP